MNIRKAEPEDAAATCNVIRRSIIEICTTDHQKDPHVLEQWLANKTPDNVERWIVDPTSAFFVAVADQAILSAGCVKDYGEVVLNYVSPDARFRGISRAIMFELEAASRCFGNSASNLDSTRTAVRFYTSLGYVERGKPSVKHGLTTFPFTRPL
jgi:GNAT superfamily N-acetyltransferase